MASVAAAAPQLRRTLPFVPARARLTIVLVLLATACASRRPAPDGEAMIAADLEMLCRRVEARNVSAWSQPVYRTPSLGPLTMRVDQGDAAARCELGRLMRRHARRPCADVSDGLVDACP
jgi:hypothetical protein